jgi:hypothetical protein
MLIDGEIYTPAEAEATKKFFKQVDAGSTRPG